MEKETSQTPDAGALELQATGQEQSKEQIQIPSKAATVKLPDIKEFLKSGVQFGHETKKWNPLMKPFIFTSRNNIHIIDIVKTMEALTAAARFLHQAASKGPILFVGTKRQAAEIVRQAAIDCGAMFITNRWPGGLLTNYAIINKSLKRFAQLEEEFEQGVLNRTKFEVSKMKKEWERMNRIYEGIKMIEKFPEAMVVIDTNYERGAIKEAKRVKIPVVAIVDTNCDPNAVDYPIPANDDALKSIELIVGILRDAVKQGNQGKGIKHEFKDFSKFKVQVVKSEEKAAEFAEIAEQRPKVFITPQITRKDYGKKGILESIQEQKDETLPKIATKVQKVTAQEIRKKASVQKTSVKQVKVKQAKSEKVVKKAKPKSDIKIKPAVKSAKKSKVKTAKKN